MSQFEHEICDCLRLSGSEVLLEAELKFLPSLLQASSRSRWHISASVLAPT